MIKTMKIQLHKAPFDQTLELLEIRSPVLQSRLHHIGLYENDNFIRLDEEISIHPVRVRGPKGEFILGKGMCLKIVTHLDDGRKLPLAELKPGESGHIEGITGGTGLGNALKTIGLKNNDRITFIRQIPSMEYTALVNSEKRVRLSEGIAAKIWGSIEQRDLQFCSAGKGKKFIVKQILGGDKARKNVYVHGKIEPGVELILEGVKPVETLTMSGAKARVVIYTTDGLRLVLDKKNSAEIYVRVVPGV